MSMNLDFAYGVNYHSTLVSSPVCSNVNKDLDPKAKDSRYHGQIFHWSFYVVFQKMFYSIGRPQLMVSM